MPKQELPKTENQKPQVSHLESADLPPEVNDYIDSIFKNKIAPLAEQLSLLKNKQGKTNDDLDKELALATELSNLLNLINQSKEQKRIVEEIKTKKESNIEGLDFEQLKEYWINFYNNINLPEFAEEISSFELNLTPEQQDLLKQKQEQGFNLPIILPSIETQQKYLNQLKQETEKPIPGLSDQEQYIDQPDSSGQKGIWLSNTVKPNFPNKISTLNRPQNQPYLMLLKDQQEPDTDTLDKTPIELRQTFKERQETGLTIQEYLIFQYDYTQKHKIHPETQKLTWLLDSELDNNSTGPGQVLRAHWGSGSRQVRVYSGTSEHHSPYHGARSAAIFQNEK